MIPYNRCYLNAYIIIVETPCINMYIFFFLNNFSNLFDKRKFYRTYSDTVYRFCLFAPGYYAYHRTYRSSATL